ncbi:hypothetical protein SAY86_003403 [Trapa natans]|uniref:Cellulose synthase-like protein E6 n=1 Tax=Trapa natans TaxID=22666 RepID=A0AAN7N1N0_TRANT|nr:hypothetical protein SAY86_003403 [Trapa natans]
MGLRAEDAGGVDKGPLFQTRSGRRGGAAYKVVAATIFLSICGVWAYRLSQLLSLLFSGEPRVGDDQMMMTTTMRKGSCYGLSLVGMFLVEVVFGLFWVLSQSIRWNIVHQLPFKDKLSLRYKDKQLPRVDIFVCTADPEREPPSMVISTVLSLMSFNYPPEKLSLYLSDDGCSELTFYALLEASDFAKQWIPFCKKFNIEPRSPEAYFARERGSGSVQHTANGWPERTAIEGLYREMKHRIDEAVKMGGISEEMKGKHKGFSEWHPKATKWDHQSIVQMIIDGRDEQSVDVEGCRLPTLVYMAREKRPGRPHNFKAGSMNAMIRVSSVISNAPVILNLDCDMYSNDSDAVQEALCFFMDERRGHQIAFVQFPQNFDNITPNDLYYNSCTIINKVEMKGMDGAGDGTQLYCGTGCFHRRESLCGIKYSEDHRPNLVEGEGTDFERSERSAVELEEAAKVVADCSYEQGTLWGYEMGLVYGCLVEDIATGIAIHCRGWKSVCYNSERRAFLGMAPDTLEMCLVQFKRWSEGMFQIFTSRYCPFTRGRGNISFLAQMAYSYYLLWAILSLPTLFYVVVPPLFLLRGVPLFPEVSFANPWFLFFLYAVGARTLYSMVEAVQCGFTLRAWWNAQRMLLLRRTSAFLFALVDTGLAQLGLSESGFVLTPKTVTTSEVQARYKREVMEFGSSSAMFTHVAVLAVLNLFCLVGGAFRVIWLGYGLLGPFTGQLLVAGTVVLINLPVYEALVIRSDHGSLPITVVFRSVVLASSACLVAVYF